MAHNLVLIPPGGSAENSILLRQQDRSTFLQLDVAMEYAVMGVTEPPLRPRFQPVVTMYMHSVSDLAGRELFAYHWHPAGVSDVREPHFHASATPPLFVPDRSRSGVAAELKFSRFHFPTHRIELAELVRFLIVEVGVGPRRADWESVLDRIQG